MAIKKNTQLIKAKKNSHSIFFGFPVSFPSLPYNFLFLSKIIRGNQKGYFEKQITNRQFLTPQSPIEQLEETNSSGQKDDEDGSEDESDEKNDSVSQDPERLKAFNVRIQFPPILLLGNLKRS